MPWVTINGNHVLIGEDEGGGSNGSGGAGNPTGGGHIGTHNPATHTGNETTDKVLKESGGFKLSSAGIKSYDVSTKSGKYAGTIGYNPKSKTYGVFFNMTATKGSKKQFASVDEATAFIKERRIKKGWSV